MVEFRIAFRRVWVDLFNYFFFDSYYKYGSRVEPYKYYMEGFAHLDEDDIYDASKTYGLYYEPSCFPMLFKINCVGCHGCVHNNKPFLQPYIPKGPYKVMLADTFKEQYEGMFGKEALFDLMWDMEKKNQEIDKNKEVTENGK